MTRKKIPARWKLLGEAMEKRIIKEYDHGVQRSKILRKYGISENQLGYIVRTSGPWRKTA